MFDSAVELTRNIFILNVFYRFSLIFKKSLFYLFFFFLNFNFSVASDTEDWSRYFDSSVSGKVSVLPEAFKHFEKKAPEGFIRCLQEKVGASDVSSFSINDVRWKKNHLKAIFKILQGSNLNTLDLNGCTFRSRDIEAMVNFFPERLKNLYLSKTNVNDIFLPGLGQKLILLETIDLSLTSISGFSLHHIMMIINISQSLKSMDLSQTALSDMVGAEKLPEVIEKAQGLESFKIYGTPLRKDPIGQRVQKIMDTRTFQRNMASSVFDGGIRQTLETLFHRREGVSTLSLKDLTLSHEDVSVLSLALKYSSCLKDVRLEGDLFSDEDIAYVMDALRHHGDLRSFVWKNRVLSERSLKDLGLDNFKHLAFLDLTSAHLGPLCCQVLFPSLEKLVLADNEMNDDVACAFADVLASHQSLKNLNLDKNPITLDGMEKIYSSLKDLKEFQKFSAQNTPFIRIVERVRKILPLLELRTLQESQEIRAERKLSIPTRYDSPYLEREIRRLQQSNLVSFSRSQKILLEECSIKDHFSSYLKGFEIFHSFLDPRIIELLSKKVFLNHLKVVDCFIKEDSLINFFTSSKKLRHLYFKPEEKISMGLLNSICQLTSLKDLRLYDLSLALSERNFSLISKMSNLERFDYDVKWNKLGSIHSSSKFKFLHNVLSLKRLYICCPNINNEGLACLFSHPTVEKIKLGFRENLISDFDMGHNFRSSRISSIKILNAFEHGKIGPKIARALSELSRLKKFHLDGHPIKYGFYNLLSNKSITDLRIDNADIVEHGIMLEKDLSHRSISLRNAHIGTFAALGFSQLQNLERISITYCRSLGKDGFRNLLDSKSLKEIDITGCEIGDIEFELPVSSSVERLMVAINCFSDKSVEKFTKFIKSSLHLKLLSFFGENRHPKDNFFSDKGLNLLRSSIPSKNYTELYFGSYFQLCFKEMIQRKKRTILLPYFNLKGYNENKFEEASMPTQQLDLDKQ